MKGSDGCLLHALNSIPLFCVCKCVGIMPSGTGLDIETSYLVYLVYMSPIYVHQIFSDSDL